MRILLLRTWLVNIGNGFIDKGAKALISHSVPDADIIEVSGYPNHVGDVNEHYGSLGTKLRGESNPQALQSNMINITELMDVDLAVLPGCVLDEHALRKYRPTIQLLAEKDVPVLLLGAGGSQYTDKTESYVRDTFEDTTIAGLVTRDSTAYELYKDMGPAYDGIDCAFWIDEYHNPPEADTQFITATFDKTEEPTITTEKLIIRPDHNPFEHPWEHPFSETVQKLVKPDSRFEDANVFMSDRIEDYLFLYANTEVTYTDRIHAALPTLVYGNRAKFTYETPRANLFERILDADISDEPAELNRQNLQMERSQQEEVVKEYISKALSHE